MLSRYLSQVTGNPKYREKAESIMEFLDGVGKKEGLLPLEVGAEVLLRDSIES